MTELISVTHDNEEKDFPVTICCRRVDDENTKMLVGYVGNEATELYKCVTEQDYLKEHDAQLISEYFDKILHLGVHFWALDGECYIRVSDIMELKEQYNVQ